MNCRQAHFILDYLEGQLSAETSIGVRAPFDALPELHQLHCQLRNDGRTCPALVQRGGRRRPFEMPEELVRAILASA